MKKLAQEMEEEAVNENFLEAIRDDHQPRDYGALLESGTTINHGN